jgi:hypothetical protein
VHDILELAMTRHFLPRAMRLRRQIENGATYTLA